MTVDDLITWLRAQLDDDEANARAVEGDGRWDVPSTGVVQLGGVDDLDGLVTAPRNVAHHMASHDPARVLAEVVTKRRLLDWLERKDDWAAQSNLWSWDSTEALALLALPYADREGYREEWRP